MKETKNRIINRGRRFASVPETIINDPNLSARAKGVATYIYFRPNDWSFYMSEILEHFRDGKDSIRGALNELVKAGYLRKTQNKCANGKFSGNTFEISDTPFTVDGKTVYGKTVDGETVYGESATTYIDRTNIDKTKIDNNTPYNPPKGEKANTSSVLANTVKELFNTICVSLPKVQLMNASRISHVKNRLKEAEVAPKDCEAYLRKFFASVEASDFLTNRNGDNRQNWKASFDWLFLPRNFLKVSEGNYTNKQSLKFDKAPAGWLGTYMKIYQTGKLPSSWDELTQDKKENIINFGKR